MSEGTGMNKGTGWIPDDADPKDFTLSNMELRKLLFQSQGLQQLATIVQGIIDDLDPVQRTFVNKLLFGKMSLLGNKTVQLISDIQNLKVEENPNVLNLVPALFIKGNAIEAGSLEHRGDTQIQIEDPSKYLTRSGESTPVILPDLLYLPILGNCDHLFKQPSQRLPPLPRKSQLTDFSRSRVEDQRALNRQSCTAHAGVALMEYFEMRRRAANPPVVSGNGPDPAAPQGTEVANEGNLSSRFLYKVTRLLSKRPGDTGASLRNTLKAMLLFGVPPEDSWPWPLNANESSDEWDLDPSAFCYAYAKNYQAVKYFRLDRPGISQPALLAQIKVALLADFPVIFGFRIFSDLQYETAVIPYCDSTKGTDLTNSDLGEIQGHTVVAIGYDDDQDIPGHRPGAIYFKNSWGASWGKAGYGWLPYDYILQATDQNKLTSDWWTLLGASWAQTKQFGLTLDHQGMILGKPVNPRTGE